MSSQVDLRETFFVECEDLLEATETGLRALADGENDPEIVNSVFRAVHSMKGGAGAFKLSELVAFAHTFETTLDRVRSGDLHPDDAVLRILLRASDQLADLVGAARSGNPGGSPASAELLDELGRLAGKDESLPTATLEFQPMVLDFTSLAAPIALDLPASSDGSFVVRLGPAHGFYQSGQDPLVVARNLAALGPVEVISVKEEIPDWNTLNFGEGFITWEFRVKTEQPEAAVREVIEFIEDAASIVPNSAAAAPLPFDLPSPVASPAAPVAALTPVLSFPADAPAERAAPVAAPPKEQAKDQGSAARQTVRVDLDRVDRLINMVGELVINQAVLSQALQRTARDADDELEAALDSLRNLSRDIQEGVMAIRAQPIKSVFQRMFRISREAADAAGKQVNLVTVGEMTEVDKTVIENLSDPLTHMIRNSVDHGVESPEKRREAGKPEQGTITLSAAHRSGRVVIEIIDDGAGINRDRVRQIAVDKGLIPADAELTLSEIDALLFLPGFSTAKEVSALSGRGVGMDVVKRAIQALGGRVSISSVRGKGTTFTISLPLTLAVMDGMVVDVAGESMVVPITAIVETLKPDPTDIHRVGAGTTVISVRGSVTPVVDLGLELGFRGPADRIEDRVLILVETEAGERAALVVDRIFDQRQVVIKSLETNYRNIPGVSAATILGNGRIALIIDPDQLAGAAPTGADDPISTLAA
jgi:two-component system, chemotaxis family, sensor kinase CheA